MECSSSSRDSNSTSPYMENYSDDFQKCREIDFSETSSSSSESETIEHPSFTDPSESSQLEESVVEATAVEIPVEEPEIPVEEHEIPIECSVTPKVEPVFQTEQIQRRKKVKQLIQHNFQKPDRSYLSSDSHLITLESGKTGPICYPRPR